MLESPTRCLDAWRIDIDDPKHPKIQVISPQVDEARKEFSEALTNKPKIAAESLGHIDYKYYADSYSSWLQKQGDTSSAANVQDELLQTLSSRKVIQKVLKEVEKQRDAYKQRKDSDHEKTAKKTSR